MTMQNDLHPDDERLAALAGGDADALADRALTAHITACDRCRPIVDELTLLRGALATLPDLAPSRPLRLIPPVPEPTAPRVGGLEWLRRLAAPAMAAGAGLVLVGAIGASGVVNELSTTRDSSTEIAAGASDSAKGPVAGGAAGSVAPDSVVPDPQTSFASGALSRTDAPRAASEGETDSTKASPSPAEGALNPYTNPPGKLPWLAVVIGGAGLFGVAAALRYSLAPRAG